MERLHYQSDMTTKEKIEAAKKRIKELETLIKSWEKKQVLYVTHLVCKDDFGVQPIYYGLTAKFKPWYFDGKTVYSGGLYETESEARAAAEQLRRDCMLR